MAGLGVQDDRPGDDFQPKLVDGIHLRWTTPADTGFPWHGFYLFRPHTQGDAVCLSGITAGLVKGRQAVFALSSNIGTVSSDAPLVLTSDFSQYHRQPGVLEFDLRNGTSLTFTPRGPLSRVEVRIGFYAEGTIELEALLGVPSSTRSEQTGSRTMSCRWFSSSMPLRHSGSRRAQPR
jgi:hypothetical protein